MENFLARLTGMNIIIDPTMIDGFRPRRTHKKRRICKKWLKRYGMEPIYDMQHTYIIGNNIIMSKGFFEHLKEGMKNDSR